MTDDHESLGSIAYAKWIEWVLEQPETWPMVTWGLLKRRASRAVPGQERDTWLAALDVVLGTQERSDQEEPSP